MKPITTRKLDRGDAFSLIEVTIALGLAAFCLVTVFALLPLGLASDQTSLDQTVASNLSSGIVADLRSTQPLGANASPRYGIVIPVPPASISGTAVTSGTTLYLSASGNASTNGQLVLGGTNASRYRVTLGFCFSSAGSFPTSMPSRKSTAVRVLITWPAVADPTPGVWTLGGAASWPSNYTGSYEENTTLDRN
jgi:hypothetical protein